MFNSFNTPDSSVHSSSSDVNSVLSNENSFEFDDELPSHRGNIPSEKDLSSHRGNIHSEIDLVSHRGTCSLQSHSGNTTQQHNTQHIVNISSHCGINVSKLNPEAPVFKSKVSVLDSSSAKIKLIELFEKVYSSKVPNYQGCRIPIPFKTFNIPLWRELLRDYDDQIICDFLEFGFPLDFDKNVVLRTNERRNHKGARDHAEFVSEYVRKEVVKTRIAGPFLSNPLSVPIMVSPLNSVPKSCSDERRIITDLSWPIGEGSVNSGISKEFYLNQKIELHYASVEDVCRMVVDIGVGAVIYKRDLRQAYRQFPVDPADYRLLGYYWNNEYYFDTVLAMGQRNAGAGCSRITRAVMHIHADSGHQGVSYLDDMIGVSHPSHGTEAYHHLGSTLSDLGLEENASKACPPSTIQTVLGVSINTVDMTISITEERLLEITVLVGRWRRKRLCNKKELQSLIGKLCFVCKCVRQSRVFLNRLLEVLRAVEWNRKTKIRLSEDFKKDLKWWDLFMKSFNGISFIPSSVWTEPDVSMATDSCLDGCGGFSSDQYFHTKFHSY